MKMAHGSGSGFTLVELLVVIAIVTMLFVAGFIAIEDSRDRADDRNIQQQFGVIRLEAELSYKTTNRFYWAVCADVSDILSQLGDVRCINGRDGYAVSALMSDGQYYCIDTLQKQPSTLTGGDHSVSSGGYDTTAGFEIGFGCNIDNSTPADCECGAGTWPQP